MRDLRAVRAELAERRARAAMVDERFETAFARLNDGDPINVVDIRCDKGDRTLLARVYVLPEGALFTSRIAWLPSDQLTLRPWERELQLAWPSLADPDDDALDDFLTRLDKQTAGLPAKGGRWLVDGGGRVVGDVLTEPAGPSGWLPGLWTRCRRHPEAAESHDRTALLAATRASLPARTVTRR